MFDGKLRVLKFSAQIIIVRNRFQVLFQPQAKENVGVGPERDGRISTLDCAQGRAGNAGALGDLRGSQFTTQTRQSEIFPNAAQPPLQ